MNLFNKTKYITKFMDNKKKIKFGIITSSDNYEQNYQLNKEIYEKIYKVFGNFCILNLSNFKFFKKKSVLKSKKNIPSHVKVYKPNDIKELKSIFQNTQLIAFNNLSKTFSFFKMYYSLNQIDLKQILLMNIGYPENKVKIQEDRNKINFLNLIYYLNKKISYTLFRFLTIINLFPKIDIYFETKLPLIKAINNYPSKKLEKKFSFIKIAYFKKVYNINCRSFTKKKNFKDKYICFVDTHFEHMDRIIREGKIELETKKKYYEYLFNLLKHLNKILKKKVVICLHPKNKDKYILKKFNKFRITRFKTNEIIRNSYLVLFHESSAALDAFVYGKRIIQLESYLLGDYLQNRVNQYADLFGIKKLRLQKTYFLNNKTLKSYLDANRKKLDKYIKNNLISDKEKLGQDKVIEIIKKEFF